jgi:hypothetical protein
MSLQSSLAILRCMKPILIAVLYVLLISGCAPAASVASLPTVVPFPTTTPGRAASGLLPTLIALPLDTQLSNPATLAALANQPSPMPNRALCPPRADATLDPQPTNIRDINNTMVRFLAAGGDATALESALRSAWGVLAANGFVRADLDLTGEGTPETVISYLSPEGGALVIAACEAAQVLLAYDSALGGEPPQILLSQDMTNDSVPELMFASRVCTGEGDDTCGYRTQIATWRAGLGRFVNLIGEPLFSADLPTVEDVDQDLVSEVVVRLDDDGDATTGPLRTGVAVYDWNGGGYVQALTQLDPPSFRIQVIQLGDAAFASAAYEEAVSFYELALTSTDLRNWQNDDVPLLQTYALYRLLLTFSFLEDERRVEIYQAMQTSYPDIAAAPIYIQLAQAFWNALEVTNNLRSACIEVQAVISTRPEAVTLLNRYGESGGTYDARALCPF